MTTQNKLKVGLKGHLQAKTITKIYSNEAQLVEEHNTKIKH